jgi:hypothetical protein
MKLANNMPKSNLLILIDIILISIFIKGFSVKYSDKNVEKPYKLMSKNLTN